MEYSSTVVDEHPEDRPPVDVASNVQWLQVLARLFRLLEHGLLGTKADLSDLLLDAPKLARQHEHHVDILVGRRRIPVFDQQRLVIIQQVHVVGGGCEHRGAGFSFTLHSHFVRIMSQMV
jgi:hypothetical protein